jgi:hypothetical protein
VRRVSEENTPWIKKKCHCTPNRVHATMKADKEIFGRKSIGVRQAQAGKSKSGRIAGIQKGRLRKVCR